MQLKDFIKRPSAGYNYFWMDGTPAGLKGYDIGLIAQEVEAVYPEIVQIDDSTGYKTIY